MGVEGVEVTNGAEMAKVSKITETTARHVIIGLVAENIEMSKMPKIFVITTRHVMCSLGSPTV
jgi:hypothetical protein